ncbi:U-box domain-containing protein [Trifolium repens]|nr:U-box domain-containing protein [Trifolium repens]
MKTITKVVLDNKVYLGIVFDIDVDRSAAVDSTGCEFNRNRLIGLMAVIVLEEMILHPSRKERRRKKSDNSAPESTSSQSDDSDRSRRSGHRSDRRSRRRRSRHESDSESSSDDSGSDRDGRKRKSSRKITEEEVAQYLAKKAQRKALKVAKKLKTNTVSGYSNDSNPFGDSNLNEKKLLAFLFAASSGCCALAAKIITSLAVVEVNKATVGAFPGAIEALVAILRDGKGRERKEAATALYALCCFCDNRKRAVDCGVVPILLRSVECGLERGVEVIGLLVKCKEGREQLESYGGCVKILVHVLRNGSSRGINESC